MLKDLSKGERFKELPGLIVKKAFDIKQSKAKDGQPGKLRQGLILTDGTAEMGFTLWGPDIGTVMEGDMLTLMGGWVHGWEGNDGVEKFDLRLRKDGGWAKTGSGVTIPQAPPVTAKTDNALEYVDIPVKAFPDPPPLSPGARVVLNDAAVIDRRITKLACLKVAARLVCNIDLPGASLTPTEDTIAVASALYDWAMKDEPRLQEPPGPESAEEMAQVLDKAETGAQEAVGEANIRRGLAALLEDTNLELVARSFVNELYAHENHIKNALKGLGYASYKPSEHEQMVAELADRKDLSKPDEIPF